MSNYDAAYEQDYYAPQDYDQGWGDEEASIGSQVFQDPNADLYVDQGMDVVAGKIAEFIPDFVKGAFQSPKYGFEPKNGGELVGQIAGESAASFTPAGLYMDGKDAFQGASKVVQGAQNGNWKEALAGVGLAGVGVLALVPVFGDAAKVAFKHLPVSSADDIAGAAASALRKSPVEAIDDAGRLAPSKLTSLIGNQSLFTHTLKQAPSFENAALGVKFIPFENAELGLGVLQTSQEGMFALAKSPLRLKEMGYSQEAVTQIVLQGNFNQFIQAVQRHDNGMLDVVIDLPE